MRKVPRPGRLRLRFIAAIVTLVAIWLAMLIGGTGWFDRAVYEAVYAGHRPLLLTLARIFTALGDPTVLVTAGFIVAAWIWWRHHPRLAFAIVLIVLVGRGLVEAQKYWIARVRPDLEPHLVVVKTQSFPSGHATSSMIFYLTVALV